MEALKYILIICALAISFSVQSQSKKQTLDYFKENYSYEWNRIDSEVSKEVVKTCKKYYEKRGEFGQRVDDIRFKKAYRVKYKDSYYLIIEFDFLDIFDHIVDFVIREGDDKLIGFFNRSLA